MHISALEEYGIRCAIQLARAYEQGPLSASKVAEKEGISVEYVSKILHLLKRSGLVSAIRGAQGGFLLSMAPSALSISRVLTSLDESRGAGSTSEDFCQKHSGHQGKCSHLESCSIRPVWTTLSSYFDQVLNELTLGDLLRREDEIQRQVATIASRKAKTLTQIFRPTEVQPHENPIL